MIFPESPEVSHLRSHLNEDAVGATGPQVEGDRPYSALPLLGKRETLSTPSM